MDLLCHYLVRSYNGLYTKESALIIPIFPERYERNLIKTETIPKVVFEIILKYMYRNKLLVRYNTYSKKGKHSSFYERCYASVKVLDEIRISYYRIY